MSNKDVFIAGGTRTPFVKSMTSYRELSLQQLMTQTLQALVKQFHLEGQVLGDVAIGAVMSSSLNWNLARECVLGTSLSPLTPAYNVQRACGTSLETTLQIALKIANQQIDCGIAGGVDSNSDLPLMAKRALTRKLMGMHYAKNTWEKMKYFFQLRPGDFMPTIPNVTEPRTHLSMGQHCERMVQEWGIGRVEQDTLAYQSHIHGAKAYQAGFYQDLVFEMQNLKQDGILRGDTTLEKLAKLKPSFDFTGKGTLTAGNSTPLTDGSAAVLLTNETYAKAHQLPMLARFVDAEAAAVDFVHGEGLLMAPTVAVSQLLARHKMTLQDFDFYEIHEAFAGQVLCTLKAWESDEYCRKVLHLDKALGPIDRSKMNVKGGSVALGHPFAATGARLVATLAKSLHQHGKGRGLISVCTAGGMGVAAILEAV